MPRALAIAEGAHITESVETPREPARIPLALKASHESQPSVAARDILADTSPAAAPGADKVPPPVSTIANASVPDANLETSRQPSGRKNGNGAAAGRTGLRLSASLRRPSVGERQSEPAVDALWPKGPRASRAVEGASIARSAGVTPIHSQQGAEAPNATASPSNADGTAAGASVLKSGVVNGMPYTLYSDGSIEAQLPGGALRFGSITELRNHIEQSA
jgi:hypothetical protein